MKDTIKIPRELISSFLMHVDKIVHVDKIYSCNIIEKSKQIRQLIEEQDQDNQSKQKFIQIPLL